LKFGDVGYCGETENQSNLRKTLQKQGENQQQTLPGTQLTFGTGPASILGALTTVPSLLLVTSIN